MNSKDGCMCKGCLLLAKWVPCVLVVTGENDNKFKLDFNIPLCDEHKSKMSLKDIVPENTLTVIQNLFRQKFIAPPTLENMTLEWNPYFSSLIVTDTNGNDLGKLGVNRGGYNG